MADELSSGWAAAHRQIPGTGAAEGGHAGDRPSSAADTADLGPDPLGDGGRTAAMAAVVAAESAAAEAAARASVAIAEAARAAAEAEAAARAADRAAGALAGSSVEPAAASEDGWTSSPVGPVRGTAAVEPPQHRSGSDISSIELAPDGGDWGSASDAAGLRDARELDAAPADGSRGEVDEPWTGGGWHSLDLPAADPLGVDAFSQDGRGSALDLPAGEADPGIGSRSDRPDRPGRDGQSSNPGWDLFAERNGRPVDGGSRSDGSVGRRPGPSGSGLPELNGHATATGGSSEQNGHRADAVRDMLGGSGGPGRDRVDGRSVDGQSADAPRDLLGGSDGSGVTDPSGRGLHGEPDRTRRPAPDRSPGARDADPVTQEMTWIDLNADLLAAPPPTATTTEPLSVQADWIDGLSTRSGRLDEPSPRSGWIDGSGSGFGLGRGDEASPRSGRADESSVWPSQADEPWLRPGRGDEASPRSGRADGTGLRPGRVDVPQPGRDETASRSGLADESSVWLAQADEPWLRLGRGDETSPRSGRADESGPRSGRPDGTALPGRADEPRPRSGPADGPAPQPGHADQTATRPGRTNGTVPPHRVDDPLAPPARRTERPSSADAPPWVPARSPMPPSATPPRHRVPESVGEVTEAMAALPPEADDPSGVTAVILPAVPRVPRRPPHAPAPERPAGQPLRIVPTAGPDDTAVRPTGPAPSPQPPVPGPVRPPVGFRPAARAVGPNVDETMVRPLGPVDPAPADTRRPSIEEAGGPSAGKAGDTSTPVPEDVDIEDGVDADDVPDDVDVPAPRSARRAAAGGRRRSLRGVLAVAAAVVLLGLAGLVTTLESEPEPEPTVAAPAAAPAAVPTPTTSSAAVDAPLRAAVDPQSRQATAYLDALRQAQIPTSRTGLAETEAAEVICQQLEHGTDQATMVRAVPAVLTTVTSAQAPAVVEAAQEHYC